MTRFVGAIDQGTTSSRFIVFDRAGNTVAMAQREHRQIYKHPGWVEHDPMEIYHNTAAVIEQALRSADLKPSDLAAVGITNQRETTVLWNRETGKPVHPAIVWQDTRVDPMVAELAREGGQDRFRAKTGLPLASYFSALKLRWLLEEVPYAYQRAEAGLLAFGTIDSWLMWHLTGEHITDVTNASRTQLMNLETLDWDDELLAVFGIPRAVLPRIVPSSGVYAEGWAPLAGVPIAGILGDQQAALMGQACLRPGEAKNTYGTGSFLLMNTGTEPVQSSHGLITTVAAKFGDQPATYALEGAIAITGALVQWLRDNLGLIKTSADIESLALSVPDNGDVYFVPAFSGLYAPYWRADARGTIAGLTRFAGAGHIARAALEATAYQVMDVVRAMEQDSGIRMVSLRVDGGMVVNRTLMQFQADMLDVPVVRPSCLETTALGAAYAAGLAVGYWAGPDDLRANWAEAARWTPAMGGDRRAALAGSWHKAIDRSMEWG
ncbi:MAG TPA: glycerol kinase [Acetobacteraceae bacterium]|jgi:glycerol kinase|nr:glycerol kinase [Acetobacteraceae bacterium]